MSYGDKFKFEERLDRIKELVRWYKTVKFNEKSFIIFLANGESFKYRCFKEHVPHLLGVKIEELAASNLFKSELASDILEELIDSPFRIGDKIADDQLKLSNVFSNYVQEKLAFFKSNVSVDTDNIMFICKYDRNKVIYQGKTPKKCDYIMFKQLEDGTILELDLVKSGKNVVPLSSRVYNDQDEASLVYEEVLKDQEVTIISSMLIDDEFREDRRKMYISEQDKISRLQLLKNLHEKYNCSINVVGDCEHYYRRNFNNRNKGKNDNDILESIVECVLSNKIIKIPSAELSFEQKALVDTLNDKIFSNGFENGDNKETYSKLQSRITKLKEAKKALEENNKKQAEELLKAQEKIDDQQKTIAKQKQLVHTIVNAVDDYKQIK